MLKSVRTERGPRQEVVLNLGTLELPKDQWKALANLIEAKINNQGTLLSEEGTCPKLEQLATHYARMIVSESINQAQDKAEEDASSHASQQAAEFHQVDINSVKTTESRSIGAEYVIAEQMQRYKFDSILQGLDFTPKQIDYAKHLLIGRAVHPSSERELVRWINDDSAVKELLGSDASVYDNALHRTAVALWERRSAIEKSLRHKARDLFSLDESVVLYDLTNTYFEGQKQGHRIAQFGRSKERRSDCKLATLALVVDANGFPKQSHILEGNVSEPGTLEQMLKTIKTLGHDLEKKTLVIDAGIATEDNLALLRKENISYLAISRKRQHDPSAWSESPDKKIRLNDGKTELSVKRVVVDIESEDESAVQQEALLLCHSPQKEIKEKQIMQRRLEGFEKALTDLSKGLSRARTTKRVEKINERIGRLKEKFGVGSCFDIKVEADGKGIATRITFERNAKGVSKLNDAGNYIIRTDRLDLSEEDISGIHRSLTRIESSFRAMKSDLGLRPNYHKCEEATLAHIFLSVLAYHMVCPILRRLSDAGLDYTWTSVRNMLSSHDRVVTAFNTEQGDCIFVRNTTTANMNQKRIYDALGLKHDPLKNIHFKKKISSTLAM